MSWRRAALDERLQILKEQLCEQLSGEDGGLLDWLEHQVKELMIVAACSDHGEYVAREASRVMAAIRLPLEGADPTTGIASIALVDPAAH